MLDFANLFARKVVVNAKPVEPEPQSLAVPFATEAGRGYLDDTRKWYATQREAEVASAKRLLHTVLIEYHEYRAFPGHAKVMTLERILNNKRFVRAMAILGEEA